MTILRSALRSALATSSALLLGGCPLVKGTEPTVTATPVGITVVQGNGQSAQAGRALPVAIVLRVVDDKGRGVPKQAATLIVASGGGTISPATVVSDSLGEMKLTWTLGQTTVVQTVMATLDGTQGALVAATAVFPALVLVAQGQSQSSKVATALKNDVVIRVVGGANQPMVGIPLTFTVTEGGGGITPQSGVTNANGEIATKWTMGAVAGQNSLVATAGSLPVANVRATATP